MLLRIIGHDYHYEMENLCRIFFPNEKITLSYDRSSAEAKTVETVLDGDKIEISCDIDGVKMLGSADTSACENMELEMGKLLFRVLSSVTGIVPPWGVLTGVRPSKLMTKYINEKGEEEAMRHFTEDLYVSDNKARLARNVAKAESGIITLSSPRSFSLYVSIPFCPGRCSYCSFVSHSIDTPSARKLVPGYIEKLCEELSQLGGVAGELGLKLESIYFGGGTPTSLEASQLDTICKSIEDSFDLSALREYTVECGRPDTVTVPKLRTLLLHNVNRISINPQTFSQPVLDAIGRRHTVEQTLNAYRLARSMGFDFINMDLIAGLTGDIYDGFCESLDTAVTLAPENITVHTLALKRSSDLAVNGADVADGEEVAKMLDYAQKRLGESGYSPYYMYRQSKSAGNLENTGWSKEGRECLYNVFMMEECHTVLAAGAGAVTKLKDPHGDYIERIFNFKYPYEYIARFDELTDRKEKIKEFYGSRI